MATQNDELKDLNGKINDTSQKVAVLHDRTQRLLDDMHGLKQAVKDLYEFVEKQHTKQIRVLAKDKEIIELTPKEGSIVIRENGEPEIYAPIDSGEVCDNDRFTLAFNIYAV